MPNKKRARRRITVLDGHPSGAKAEDPRWQHIVEQAADQGHARDLPKPVGLMPTGAYGLKRYTTGSGMAVYTLRYFQRRDGEYYGTVNIGKWRAPAMHRGKPGWSKPIETEGLVIDVRGKPVDREESPTWKARVHLDDKGLPVPVRLAADGHEIVPPVVARLLHMEANAP